MSDKRAEMPGGSWTNKMGGEFQDGDPSTAFFFEGRADIKELGGHLRVFFKDIAVVKRPMEVSEARKNEMLENYRKERKEKRRQTYGPDADSSSDEEEDVKKEREDREINMLIKEEKEKPVIMPKISIYLTTKKPKTRMVDAHKTGCKVFIGTNVEVPFGKIDAVKSYEAPLRDISDISGFQGLVALKLPQDEPVTENPVIYGLIKLMSYRSMKKRTVEALHLADLNEEIEHILLNRKEDPSAPEKSPNKQKTVPTAIPVATAIPDVVTASGRNATDNIKSLSVYRKAASKTWLHFQLPETEEVDFFMFLRMLDFNDIFLIRTQAIRIFNAIDIQGDHWLGISEFENCLMALDMLGNSGQDLVVLDVFDSLKSLPLKQVISETYDKKADGTPTKEGAAAAAAAAKVEKPKPKVIPGDKNSTPTFLQTKEILESSNNPLMGLDYSAYCEAIQMLGVPTTLDDEQRRESFMFGGNVKIRDIEHKYLNLAEFRKAWLKVADLKVEMEARGMKFEFGVFAQARNRDRLSRAMETVEAAYLNNLKKANEVVENVKSERRIKKDKKRSDFEAHRAKLLHEANKFIAVRGQEKRLLIKKEQEEKSKKRNEDKILRNKLLLRQQENLQQKRMEIAAANKEKEKLRVAEIKARGWDKIDRSVQSLRHIDPELYTTPDAQSRLQYALLIDFSHNLLDTLPPDNFLYWMSECRKLKLSENRLRVIPSDINNMGNLEILEMDTNRIESLPDGLCDLRNLQRLDISNNQLHTLPNAIGNCAALRYFCAHSNHLSYIPTSLGQCYKLEYIDFSRNQIAELPEDMQNLMSLTHLDCNSNRLGILPNYLGDCTKMLYLDMSTNLIAILPPSFSKLTQLEYCNFENNSVVVTKNSFNTCGALKYLNLRKNHCDRIYADIGKAINLSYLNCSVNSIESIPLEMGLLSELQELDLSRNKLSTIPPELGSCVKLQRLEIPYNAVVGMLPETIGLIHSLVYLDISFNQVDELPRSVIGLMNLVELRAERCCLMEFPDTITYLDNLKLIDVSNNNFRRFPIELQYMKSLKTLNLANNALTLLPRNISTMTILDNLDMSRNKIRALPVEFTAILESVGTVELHSNPWSDLPPRWGKLWPGTHATQGPQGYSLSEAVDFLYGMRSFYDTAEEIWLELGMFHYAGRLGFEDFLQELRNRIPKTWHEGLVDYAKYIYFKSRETGVFVRWYSLDEATTEENQKRVAADQKRRDYNVQKSRDELEMKHAMGKIIYSGDMNRKVRHVNELAIEHEKSQEVINHIHMTTLYSNVKTYEKTLEKRHKQRENWFERRRMAEMKRLEEILDADKEGRAADRQYRKENRDELNPYVKSYVA